VRGHGVDAEMGGTLKIGGDAAAPVISMAPLPVVALQQAAKATSPPLTVILFVVALHQHRHSFSGYIRVARNASMIRSTDRIRL
jgi:hypothetical protein